MNRISILIATLLSVCIFSVQEVRADAKDAPKAIADYAEDYVKLTNDGAWCWFSDPRAIYVDDKLIGGFVDKEGSIWAFSYNSDTQETTQYKLYDKLNYDDHANPSFMALPDKRIAAFFSAHGPSPIYYTISKHPADISEWEPLTELTPDVNGNRGYCYTNPMMLSQEDNKVYLFFRGCNFKPCMISTTDMKNWSEVLTVVDKREGPQQGGRPYMKVTSNNKDKIFLAFTDGHPRGEATNSIYFIMYQDGAFRKANGEKLTEGMTSVYPDMAEVVYDAKKTFDKAWIWDIAVDKNDNPVLVYARFSEQNGEHSYWYARWTGEKWENHHITKAGQWFMRNNYNDKNLIEKENNYSGGVYLDHNDPAIVYTSRPINNVFEIEKWTFNEKSRKWARETVTEESERDNVRPFVARNYPEGKPNLLWMYNYKYPHFTSYDCAIRINQKAKGFDASFDKKAVEKVANSVFDWQIRAYKAAPFDSRTARNWLSGVMFVGMFDWAETTENKAYFKFMNDVFNKEQWHLGNRMYHADDLVIGQAYLDMYKKFGNENMLIPTQARLEWIISHPPGENIDNRVGRSDRWWWCDALYMAPGVFTRLWDITGNKKIMKFAHQEFIATYNQLYDQDEDLFYRDSKFIEPREANGEKIFWSRGNAWVLGGLAEILKTLPENDKKYRPYYVALFQEMSKRIASLQHEDGFWRSSLLDPETYPNPETSGTSLYTAALAYGINAGYLSREEYLPVVEKGWKALVSSVDTEGKLGWVQPVAASPRSLQKKNTQLYGVGGFLSAASEVYKLSK